MMKQYRLTLFSFTVLLFALCARGQETEKSLFDQAVAAYSEAEYPRAIELFQEILTDSTSERTSEMYYNLGCAYYKNGDLAPAILNFHRAYRLAPTDGDVRFNLQLSSSQTIDKMDSMPRFFLFNWLDSASHWMGLKGWMWFGIIAFALAVMGFGIYFKINSSNGKRVGFFSGIFFLLLSIFANLMLYRSYHFIYDTEEAIVMSEVVTVKSAPDQSSRDIVVIHSGLKVEMQSRLGGYIEVMLPDGTVGWVLENDIEPIYNF